MSKATTAQFCRQNENGSLTADTPLHTRSITEAYSLIKNSRPRSNGRLYLFQYYYLSIAAQALLHKYCCIGLIQPGEHTSAGYFPIQQHAQKNSQSLCIFFFDSASQKRLFCIVVNRSKKNPITPQRRHPDGKATCYSHDIEAPKVPQLRWPQRIRFHSYPRSP